MKTKKVFFCTNCGSETLKWSGKCPVCGSWNTVQEQTITVSKSKNDSALFTPTGHALLLSDVESEKETRFSTGIGELDRVLGGGAVEGSMILIGGTPGIGKSTLLLQICNTLCNMGTTLYVTGEESGKQLKMRAERLNISCSNLYILSETNLQAILDSTDVVKPKFLIADSIQTIYSTDSDSAPGSISQVKECTMQFMQIAKKLDITVFIVGHVNKEGAIAGPRVLEHMVDCVLYFEGDHNFSYRILRSVKNRFGSTNEIGVFEMSDNGLSEVPNPSEMLLMGRPENSPGTCVTCIMEGTRPILAEIQALVASTSFNVPRRTSNGIDYNRAMLLIAVLEKRGGIKLNMCDTYVNVIGGLSIDEPAADLATLLAIASSRLDKPIGDDVVAIGEVGLTGEIRSVSSLNQRLSEINRLGFSKCIIPKNTKETIVRPDNLQILEVSNLSEALAYTIGAKAQR